MNPAKVKLSLCVLVLLALGMALSGGGISVIGQPAPVPDEGFRVLITYADAARDTLPQGQQDILKSPTLRDYLDKYCVKDSHGNAEWRIEKDTTQFGTDQPIWQRMMAVPRKQSQWLVAGDGKRGTSQPLPPDEKALMAVLTPLGGL